MPASVCNSDERVPHSQIGICVTEFIKSKPVNLAQTHLFSLPSPLAKCQRGGVRGTPLLRMIESMQNALYLTFVAQPRARVPPMDECKPGLLTRNYAALCGSTPSVSHSLRLILRSRGWASTCRMGTRADIALVRGFASRSFRCRRRRDGKLAFTGDGGCDR